MSEIKYDNPNLDRFEKEQKKNAETEEKIKLQLKERKKLKSRLTKLFVGIGTILILGISIQLYYNYRIAQNGIETEGMITSVNHQNARMNDMDGTWINSYYIEYAFEVDGKTHSGFQEIGGSELHKYFVKEPAIGDQVSIIYDPAHLKNNHIAGVENEW